MTQVLTEQQRKARRLQLLLLAASDDLFQFEREAENQGREVSPKLRRAWKTIQDEAEALGAEREAGGE